MPMTPHSDVNSFKDRRLTYTVYKFLIIAMAIAVAAGFVFIWHEWNIRRTLPWLICSILITAVVVMCIIFAAVSIIFMALEL